MSQGPFLILLVGSNPLPNYLAACALRPSRVALVYTDETKEAKDRLKRELKAKLGESVVIEEPFIEDATCATTVRRRFLDPFMWNEDGGDLLLNYTGGTKVMAAHALMVFTEAHRKPERASYLDEGGRDKSGVDHQPRLRFDNKTWQALSSYTDTRLELKTLLALHGITHKPREPTAPAPTSDDAHEILCKVLADLPLAAALYCERERLQEFEKKPAKATSKPFRAECYGLKLSLPAFPTDALLNGMANRPDRESWFKQWYKFIGGEWLEEWLGEQIRGLQLVPAPEIIVGFDAFRGSKKTQLEIDVAVVRGHRSYFVSCTTDRSKRLSKSKLFEVAVRSRQLGGDLARAALVCLADNPVVSALRDEVDDRKEVHEDIRVPSVADVRVFGLEDIRTWSDCDGKQANLHSLRTWLES